MIMLNTGTIILDDKKNEYKLGDIVGSGGFGYVFKAIRKNDNKVFAVKTMFPSFSDTKDQIVFENEITLATKIVGDNIIHYEFVNDGKILPNYPPYIIMEYANGGTLKELIRNRDKKLFSNDQIISMFTQLANGMKIINEKLIHRDIKPDNILLCDNILKISDFGLSKIATERTRTHSFKGGGTPLYMSPEAWNFATNKIQMDIYSMGIVFFEIASLQYPYNSKMDTYEECKRVHLNGGIKNLSQLNCNLSQTIISIINRMLEKAEQRRFNNWNEVISFIEKNENKTRQTSSIVNSLIEIKSSAEIQKQKQIEAFLKKQQIENDFYEMVKSQFENDICGTINRMANEYNETCASNDKFTLIRARKYNKPEYYYEFWTPFNENIVIGIWAVLENSLQKEKYNMWASTNGYREDVFGPKTYPVNYTLTYNKRPIIGLVSIISEETQLGFNLMLLKGNGLYGDWFIMKNSNNFILLSGNKRKEPFAFDFNELPKQIDNEQSNNYYSFTSEPYTENVFLQTLFSILKKS